MRSFDGQWRCAGCGIVVNFALELDQRAIDRVFNPARYVAEQRNLKAREIAQCHTKQGCALPV